MTSIVNRYAQEEAAAGEQDEVGWKYIHADVFRFPPFKRSDSYPLRALRASKVLPLRPILGFAEYFGASELSIVLRGACPEGLRSKALFRDIRRSLPSRGVRS